MQDADFGQRTIADSSSVVPASHRAAYVLIILGAVLAASYYHLRTTTIFACPAEEYSRERYLVYCQAEGYGDYDHGAFWFNLEPEATTSAAAADVLFLGNSRMQFAFSSTATQDWLARNASSYYLLGFAYSERVPFEHALLAKLAPRARVYVINLDSFFEEEASVPANIVMNEPDALSRYRRKQLWQYPHRAVCGRFSGLCGKSMAFFRARHTGVWQRSGEWDLSVTLGEKAVSLDPKLDTELVARETVSGRKFLDSLGVDPGCVIFTVVPTVQTSSVTDAALAAALHIDFISPYPGGLMTFDGSHLDSASAERWSEAFFEAAGPKIRQCVQPQGTARIASAK